MSLALLVLGGWLALVFLGPRESLPGVVRETQDQNVLRIVYTQLLRPDPHVRALPLSTYNQFILSLGSRWWNAIPSPVNRSRRRRRVGSGRTITVC